MPAPVHLTAQAERRLKAGHLWIYAHELVGVRPEMHGNIVRVNDSRGNFFAHGFYSAKSRIAVRILNRHSLLPDRSFFAQAVRAATQKRAGKIGPGRAVRLVNSEGDLLPGLVVDWYAGQAVLQCLIPGVDKLKEMFAELIEEEYKPEGLWFRNDASIRETEELPLEKFFWRGAEKKEVVVDEGGLKFAINIIEGHKTGSYLDQAGNHLAAEKYARGRALDAFCFSGGFALHLARKAEEVVALDSSQPALAALEKNIELNGLRNIKPVRGDIFALLPELVKAGEKYSLVVIDPPPFAKSRKDLAAAAKGYYELNRRALSLLVPGGILMTYSCSHHFGLADLIDTVQKAGADLGRQTRLIEIQTQASDHPILLSTPETWYLKGLVAEVA